MSQPPGSISVRVPACPCWRSRRFRAPVWARESRAAVGREAWRRLSRHGHLRSAGLVSQTGLPSGNRRLMRLGRGDVLAILPRAGPAPLSAMWLAATLPPCERRRDLTYAAIVGAQLMLILLAPGLALRPYDLTCRVPVNTLSRSLRRRMASTSGCSPRPRGSNRTGVRPTSREPATSTS